MKTFNLRLLQLTIALLFVSSVLALAYAEKRIGDLVGPSLFIQPEPVKVEEDEELPTMEELDALVDELEVQFDLLMVDVFKAFTQVYLPSREEHSELSTSEFEALVEERRALLEKSCTPGIDNDNQLYSLECRDDDRSPLKIGFGHPVYNNLIISINRHSLLTKLRDGKNRIGTKVRITQKQNMYELGGDILVIGTHTREKETLGVLVMKPKVFRVYCRILSFAPITLDNNYWPADECATALREGIVVLKRLNKDL